MVTYRIDPYAPVITLYAEIKGAIIALFGLSRGSIKDRVGREHGMQSNWFFVTGVCEDWYLCSRCKKPRDFTRNFFLERKAYQTTFLLRKNLD